MNDRFKFRIFDKETRKYYKTRISKGSGCIVYQHPASSHYAWIQIGTMFAELERDEKTYALTELEPDFIIEQCTGLSDKNGNLIYEGDVVKIGNGSINGEVIESDLVVEWICKNGRYNLPTWTSDVPDWSHYVEIIGNIHEQAEQKD